MPPARTRQRQRKGNLPLIPLTDAVVFPHMDISIQIGTGKALRALDAALGEGRRIILAGRKTNGPSDEDSIENLASIGVIASIEQILAAPGSGQRLAIHGIVRAELGQVTQEEPYYRFDYVERPDVVMKTDEISALMAEVVAQIDSYISMVPGIPNEITNFVRGIEDPGQLADTSGYSPDYTFDQRIELLGMFDPVARLRRVSEMLRRQLEILTLRQKIQEEVHAGVDKSQREFFLREQIKVIRKELGEVDPEAALIEEIEAKIAAAGMPDTTRQKAEHELERLQHQGPHSPEAGMIRTYLDWLVELPWSHLTEDQLDLAVAADVLDTDHYGLEKVKERILEYIAVRKLAGERMRSPILCFVGPPGVGKTSLGRSIARALGRTFVRMSLGGVHDEAEVRGHRRTYIGALPGRILQGMRSAKTRNPIFMLDEIDKLGADFRGDPSSALLEVLDPEQNNTFSDHYIEVPFDLSRTIFITTANLLDPIPPALRDRMEVIEIPGYTEEEKVRIAQGFLVPKQLEAHGLTPEHLAFDVEALFALVRGYTREAGVRNLEREIANICRKIARKVAGGAANAVSITRDDLATHLGPRRFTHGLAEERDEIGVATGLAVTQVGGDVLSIEVSITEGSGALTLTGQLGSVMQESAQAAVTYARSRASALGLKPKFLDDHNVHIHVPAGAIQKDGPSAGVAMATALVSTLSGRSVRREIAMTGEITLRGKVLPIGGLKDKALAAVRAGITTLVFPRENLKDLAEVPENVQKQLQLVPVDNIDQVLGIALMAAEPLVPIAALSAT